MVAVLSHPSNFLVAPLPVTVRVTRVPVAVLHAYPLQCYTRARCSVTCVSVTVLHAFPLQRYMRVRYSTCYMRIRYSTCYMRIRYSVICAPVTMLHACPLQCYMRVRYNVTCVQFTFVSTRNFTHTEKYIIIFGNEITNKRR